MLKSFRQLTPGIITQSLLVGCRRFACWIWADSLLAFVLLLGQLWKASSSLNVSSYSKRLFSSLDFLSLANRKETERASSLLSSQSDWNHDCSAAHRRSSAPVASSLSLSSYLFFVSFLFYPKGKKIKKSKFFFSTWKEIEGGAIFGARKILRVSLSLSVYNTTKEGRRWRRKKKGRIEVYITFFFKVWPSSSFSIPPPAGFISIFLLLLRIRNGRREEKCVVCSFADRWCLLCWREGGRRGRKRKKKVHIKVWHGSQSQRESSLL